MEALVVDAGSKLLKAGAAFPDQTPAMVIHSQMKQMVDDRSSSADNPTTVFEDVTLDPIERGLIRDWDAMKDLLHITPVLEGAVQHIASKRFELGGTELTKLFAQELGESNPTMNLNMSDIEKLKEQYANCAEDEIAYEKTQNCEIEQHTLPDGQVINIGRERYSVGEALFQPSILGLEEHGIVEQLVRIISTVSSENHRQLLENTVLCGGTTTMTGFESRFQKESNLCSSAIRPTLVKPPEYMPENLGMYSAWVGGAILAKVVFPQNQHVTKADYDETGPSVVHRKCF